MSLKSEDSLVYESSPKAIDISEQLQTTMELDYTPISEDHEINSLNPNEWRNIPRCITDCIKIMLSTIIKNDSNHSDLFSKYFRTQHKTTNLLQQQFDKTDSKLLSLSDSLEKLEASFANDLARMRKDLHEAIDTVELKMDKNQANVNLNISDFSKRLMKFDESAKIRNYCDTKCAELGGEIRNTRFQVRNDVKDQIDEFKKQNLFVEGLIGAGAKYSELSQFLRAIDEKFDEVVEEGKTEADLRTNSCSKLDKEVKKVKTKLEEVQKKNEDQAQTLKKFENNFDQLQKEKEEEEREWNEKEEERERADQEKAELIKEQIQLEHLEQNKASKSFQDNEDLVLKEITTFKASTKKELKDLNSTIAFLHAEIEEVKESNTNLVSNVDAWKTQAEELKKCKLEVSRVEDDLKEEMAKISFNVKESYNLSMEELRRLQDSQGTQLSSSRLASSKPGTAAVSPPEEINHFAIASSEGIETSAPQNEGALAERFKKIEEENKNRDKKAKDKQKKSQLIQNKINTDLLEKVHKLEYVVENGQSIKIRGKRIEDFLREELNQSLLQNINELQDNLGKNGVKLGKVDKRLTKIEQYFKDNSLAVEVTEIKMKDFEELEGRVKNIESELDIKEKRLMGSQSPKHSKQFSMRIDAMDSRLQDIETKQHCLEMSVRDSKIEIQTFGKKEGREILKSVHKTPGDDSKMLKNFESSIESYSHLKLQEMPKEGETSPNYSSTYTNYQSNPFLSSPDKKGEKNSRKGVPILAENLPTIVPEEERSHREHQEQQKKKPTNIRKIYNKETFSQNQKYQQEMVNTYKLPPILNDNQITPQALQMLIPKTEEKPISVKYEQIPGFHQFPFNK